MPIAYYKPNPRVTGTACSFYLSNKDNRFYACLIKQDAWNPTTKTGSFSKNVNNPAKKVNIKFSNFEIGGILDAIDHNRSFSVYHNGGTTQFSSSIKFEPYMKDGAQVGYSFMVTKSSKEDSTNKSSFVIGLNFAEGRLLKEYLVYLLGKCFLAEEVNYAANGRSNDSHSEPSEAEFTETKETPQSSPATPLPAKNSPSKAPVVAVDIEL